MKYLHLLDNAVAEKIKSMLPQKIGLVFDGWSSGTTHYVALYAVFPKDGCRQQVLLAMQPLFDETNQTAANHVEYITGVVQHYNRNVDDILFLCGDNCNTNKRIALDMHVPLIGCHSHLFNLAVESYLDTNFKDVVAKIEKLSGKLRNRKAAGKLRAYGCKLEAISRNTTRWSSAFMMLKRYREIKAFMNAARFPELVELIPTPTEETIVDGMFATMEKLQSITIALQNNELKLSDARVLLDAASALIPGHEDYLALDADIIQSATYISAVVKIQNEEAALLTLEEENLVTNFRIQRVVAEDNADTCVDFATELLMARKKPKITSEYTNLDWIPPTSNVVERLFSLARLTFTDYRKATLPENLESTLFLKINADLWDIQTLASLMTSDKEQ